MSIRRAISGFIFGLASTAFLLAIGADYTDVFIGAMVGYLFGADGIGERQ